MLWGVRDCSYNFCLDFYNNILNSFIYSKTYIFLPIRFYTKKKEKNGGGGSLFGGFFLQEFFLNKGYDLKKKTSVKRVQFFSNLQFTKQNSQYLKKMLTF